MTISRKLLLVFFLFVAVAGAVDGHFESLGVYTPAPLNLAEAFAFGAVLFAWYFFDAREHSFVRSKLLDVSVIALSIVAIPIYLVRSRPEGQKARAVMVFIALLILTGVLTWISLSAVLWLKQA